MRVNGGADMQADELGGGTLGATGSATSPTTTGFTTSGLVSSAHVGKLVVLGGVWGVVTANTTTTVTVDQWYTPGLGTTTAAATPSAGTFVILPGRAPAIFMAITTDATSPNATDTTLPSEIVAASSGCLRKLATYAHTTSATSYTMTTTYTYTSTDSSFGSRSIAKMGMFNTVVGATGIIQFETLLSAAATLTATGDALTVTQTVTM